MSTANEAYPLRVFDARSLGDAYIGPVHIWDIDKTYLSTSFSSARGMLRIPVEFAIDKRAIAGMPQILQALRYGPGPRYEAIPLYFISASPPQLKRVVEHKMMLDGVEHDGLTFKDWTGVLQSWHPARLRLQVGFKLAALLDGRVRRPRATEYLYGDDVEHDATAFSLYARLLAERPAWPTARQWLARAGVRPYDQKPIRALLDAIPPLAGEVGRIFIHLEAGSDPAHVAAAGPLVTPIRGSVQLAIALHGDGLIRAAGLKKVIRSRLGSDLDLPGLGKLVEDARKRALASRQTFDVLAPLLGAQ